MKTMIVFLGERRMMYKNKRSTYEKGGKAKKNGNAAARREYKDGGKVMKNAMRTCMPN